jgi:hypothetical protein
MTQEERSESEMIKHSVVQAAITTKLSRTALWAVEVRKALCSLVRSFDIQEDSSFTDAGTSVEASTVRHTRCHFRAEVNLARLYTQILSCAGLKERNWAKSSAACRRCASACQVTPFETSHKVPTPPCRSSSPSGSPTCRRCAWQYLSRLRRVVCP